MSRMMIAVSICLTLLILAAFAFFSAFRYMNEKDDMPERILFIVLGTITVLFAVFVTIGIMTT